MASPQRRRRTADWAIPTAVCVVVVLAAAMIGRLTQGGDTAAFYAQLPTPDWAPPSSVFGPVWGALYVMIAAAGARRWYVAGTWNRAGVGMWFWLAQLAGNAAWPGVFFGLGELGWAIVVIVVLDVLVIATIAHFWLRDRLAALLLVPYLAWIVFATALNIAIWTAQ